MTTTTGFATGAYAATSNLLQARGAGGGAGIGAAAALGAPTGTGGGFGQMLQAAMDGVAESGRKADAGAMAAASGKTDLVDVVTAVAESETALQTLVAVRDRVISAYEEIMRMQI
jgi:flagellar hook-basal body complex protein FliE